MIHFIENFLRKKNRPLISNRDNVEYNRVRGRLTIQQLLTGLGFFYNCFSTIRKRLQRLGSQPRRGCRMVETVAPGATNPVGVVDWSQDENQRQMANTYTQLNIHLVFAVEERACVISRELGDRLYSYMAGILKKHTCYPLAINGFRDHVHLFFEIPPVKSVSEIAKDVKQFSTNWINENRFIPAHFRWQEGYSAFSHTRSQRDTVIKHINKQEEHHLSQSFRDEYIHILEKFQIEYDEEYVFKWIDE